MLTTPEFSIAELEDHPVIIKDGTWAVLEIDPDKVESLADVNSLLGKLVDEETLLFFGQDNDIITDWENGALSQAVFVVIDEDGDISIKNLDSLKELSVMVRRTI